MGLTDALLFGPRRVRGVVGWCVRRAAGDRLAFERLTGINLEELDESLTHVGEWFEELYHDTKDD